MPSNDPLDSLELPAGVRLSLLPPVNRRLKRPPPQWAVWLGPDRVGVIEQWRVSSASATFYRATATHPGTGKSIPLESSTNLAERVDKVLTAWRDPDRFVYRNSRD
ncbi:MULTISPECIES: hypothetical protein [Brevibacterium]|uniref:Uncharacterized protein n=2 Tax=Brevibacterium TaxID=1696 RepID=A0A6G8KTK3_9MICO|nr:MULTISPECIES: hypothetical protein [Brevibacterium]MBD8021424.1 hypothetical protein [Brevibacterium gallinarum]QIN28142.1 hypothetical protein EW640_01720 [Brevibacterium luteolum]